MDVEVNGIRMHYTLEPHDAEPTVVLLHGYTLDRTYWQPQVDALRGRYRVLVPDLRGFGDSALGEVDFNSSTVMADDVRTLLDTLGLSEPIVLVGLSMGGSVAMTFADRYPERLRALVLADTRAEPYDEQDRQGRLAVADQVEREQSTRAAREAIYPLLMAPAGYQDPALVAHVQRMAARPTPAAIVATMRATAVRPDFRPLLGKIACPTLVIVGEHDALTPPDAARVIQQSIPGAELAIIPGIGHLSNLEAPEAFNRVLLDFLERQGRS
jgi:pimeloyl-ACP methyl ester carboxylesterase